MNEARAGLPPRVAATLSLLPTPWLLFITSSHELYVRNQEELGRQIDVLIPFWGAFVASLLLGLGLWEYRRFLAARYGLWAYYLAGMFFLGFSFLRGLRSGDYFLLRSFDTVQGAGFLFSSFGLALILCGRRQPGGLAVPLGAFGLLIATGDVVRLAPRVAWAAPVEAETPLLMGGEPGKRSYGNVYHVIFDALQGDLFEASLANRDRTALEGCVIFSGSRSLSSSTRESLPHIFTGSRLGDGGRAEEGLRRAFNDGSVSFLDPLRRAGVRTVAFVPRSAYPPVLGLFDAVRYHDENVRTDDLRVMNHVTMRRLWLFSSFPLPLAAAPWRRPDAFEGFDGDELRRLDNQRLLSYAAPIASYLSFRRFLEREPSLPAEGRYTLIHILIPHAPMVLGPECAYDPYGKRTTPLEQFSCASRMVLDLMSTLRQLGRFDSSLILIHGDHGVSFRLAGTRLINDDDALMRPLLMIKAPGARSPLRLSKSESTLLDIAPTIFDWLGTGAGAAVEGESLIKKLADAFNPGAERPILRAMREPPFRQSGNP